MVQTKVIDNFTGSLTRKLNGDLNSGLAKFVTSFGYDPFSKPGNLTWFEQPTDISGNVIDTLLDAKLTVDSNNGLAYAVGSQARMYSIQTNSRTNPNVDSSSILSLFAVTTPTFLFGGDLEYYNNKIFVSHDSGIAIMTTAGASESALAGSYATNTYKPMTQFLGKLYFGNGSNIGEIDTTNLVTSSAKLSPALPPNLTIRDLDVSLDGNYLLITASYIASERIEITYDLPSSTAGTSYIFRWNGTDAGITSFTTIPSYAVTTLQTYKDNEMYFSSDSFGASLSVNGTKSLTLPNNKSPILNSTTTNGDFISWISPEAVDSTLKASMYYYGKLDEDSPLGLWRMFRLSSTQSNGFIHQTPLNILTNNKYTTVNAAITALVIDGYGKHYFSTSSSNNVTNVSKLYRFLVTSTGSGTPQLGVYETQTQLWSKKVDIKQIRVYTEPTATGNGFQVDLIDSAGNVMNNGTFNYAFTAGTDVQALQGSLDRINLNPTVNSTYSVGIRITNTGSTNMTIHKIEVDWDESGK